MSGRKTTYVPADMSMSVVDEPEEAAGATGGDAETEDRTKWVNPNATFIGDRPTHEASWLHGPDSETYMERVDLRGKLREAELKLYRADTQIAKLKQDKERLESAVRSFQSRLQDTNAMNASQIRGEKRKSETATVEADSLRKKLKMEEEKVLAEKKARNDVVARLEKRLLEKDQEAGERKEEIAELQRRLRELAMSNKSFKEEVAGLETQLKEMSSSSARGRDRISSAKYEVEKELNAVKNELMDTKLKLREAEQSLKDFDEMKKLESVFYTKLTDVPKILLEIEQLRKENDLFRRGSARTLVLEAETTDLRNQIKSLNQTIAGFGDLKSQKAVVDARLSSWVAVAKKLVPVTSGGSQAPGPDDVAAAIASLQHVQINLSQKNDALSSEMKILKAHLAEEKGKSADLKLRHTTLEEKVASLEKQLKNMTKQKHLLTLERDSCRRLLDSYQNDITSTFSPADRRAAELEELLEEYKTEMGRLQSDLAKNAAESERARLSTIPEVTEAHFDHTSKDDSHWEEVEALKSSNETYAKQTASLEAAVASLRDALQDRETRLEASESGRLKLESEVRARQMGASGDGRARGKDAELLEIELEAVSKELAALRKEKTEVLSDQKKVVGHFQELALKKEAVEQEKARSESLASSLQEALTEAEIKMRQTETDLNLSRTEAETLKSCVEDMEVVQRDAGALQKELETKNAELQATIEKLEEKIKSMESEKEELEKKLKGLESEKSQSEDRNKALESEKEEIETKVRELEVEKRELTEKTAALEAELEELKKQPSAGEEAPHPEASASMDVDDREKTETAAVAEEPSEIVVRLRDNPLAWHMAERERMHEMLKAEVESLRRKLAAGESSSTSSSKPGNLDATMVNKEDEYSYKKIQDLQSALKRTERMMDRLRKSFKEASQEFREIVYQSLGYKVDKVNQDEYKLTSLYAESPDEFFLLRRNKNGQLEMLQSDLCEANKTAVEHYLTKMNSIPSFFASVTLDLCARETM